MGNDLQPGINLVDGQWVHDADLNALVGNATILPTAISSRSLKATLGSGDEFLINDAGTLRKVTTQQIVTATTVPTGSMMDYAGSTEPLGWVFCYGQAISRTTYAALFTCIGTTYGAGDGSSTFNVPDCRDRVTAGKGNMGGTAKGLITSAMSGFDSNVLGNVGGSESHTMVTGEMPAHTHTVNGVDHLHPVTGVDHTHQVPPHSHPITVYPTYQSGSEQVLQKRWVFWDTQTGGNTGNSSAFNTGAADRSLATSTGAADRSLNSTAASTGGGAGHRNLGPRIMLNKIIKT